MRTFAAVLTLTLATTILGAPRAMAADRETEKGGPTLVRVQTVDFGPLRPLTSPQIALRASHKRPALLPALYITMGVLQGLDIYTTTRNLRAGARELNPAMAPVAGNVWAMTAVKAGTTAASIFVAERLWRKSKVAAIASMVASNAILTTVVTMNQQNRPR